MESNVLNKICVLIPEIQRDNYYFDFGVFISD